MSMRPTLETVIQGGSFDLPEMLDRIDVFYASGKLTKSEREALAEKARERAKPSDSMAPLAERMAAMELAYKALEARVAALEKPDAAEPDAPAEAEALPYVQPTGAHDAYGAGDRVVYGGSVWESTMDGNVWPPDVYPQGWALVGTAPSDSAEPDPEPAEQ